MGHKNGRYPGLLLDAADLFTHLKAQARVQVGKRFVQQQEAGVLHQGSGNRDALLLASRQLLGLAAQHVLHVDKPGHFHSPCLPLCFGNLLDLQGKADIAQHRHVRVKRVVLKYQANAALFGGDVRNILIIKQDLALCNGQDPREHVEHRAFAAARRSQQAYELAILQRDAEVVHRRKVTEFLGKVLHHNAHSRTLRSIK
ncbi:hypothetical protein SDC9_143871 [bioreactor metagenome]|uniref:Uncharacterized protein n=1 Tax=bioreactor metagenome TaxID=1076179 RepID=A0A645E5C6_9ZZZZ